MTVSIDLRQGELGTFPSSLRLNDSAIASTGVLMLTYEVAGPVEIGSFALEEPSGVEQAGQVAETRAKRAATGR